MLNPFNINNDQDGNSIHIRLVTGLLAHSGLNSSREVTNMTGSRPSRRAARFRASRKKALPKILSIHQGVMLKFIRVEDTVEILISLSLSFICIHTYNPAFNLYGVPWY